MTSAPHGKLLVAADAKEARTVGELFGELAVKTSTLVHQEVILTTAEMTEKATYAAKQSVYVLVGAVLAGVGLLAVEGALILGLGAFIPLWASALLVGLVNLAVAAVVAQKGLRALRTMDLVPKQTMQSLADAKTWAQEQIR